MKILFSLLAIGEKYSKSSIILIDELLSNTKHDVLVTTDSLDYYPRYSTRVTVREDLDKDILLNYGSEFNYNLKYNAFNNIPLGYDCIVYLDCDIKNKFWNKESDLLLEEILVNHDFIASRLNCTLQGELDQLARDGSCLFSHKIDSYEPQKWPDKTLYNSKLPSEHFFALKYDANKLVKFYEKWRELNFILQNQHDKGVKSWGDGFEIGISAYYAGYRDCYDLNFSEQQVKLGLIFNGNKI
jgi:hypothetical protein